MTGFSPHWLALREPADVRARNAALAARAAGLISAHGPQRIVDLGAGTGSNLRASAALFGPEQHWRLLDYDPRLLTEARRALAAWADESVTDGGSLVLGKDGRRIVVDFAEADLSASLADIGLSQPHLVTASAFFDLASKSFVDAFAAEVARLRAAFFTVLTCDGRDAWHPPHPQDGAIAAAFQADQGKDKGFGPALGNAASDNLERAFRANGYAVVRANSPWRLDAESRALVAALAEGTANAALESGRVPQAAALDWARGKTGCEIGHTDLLGWPETLSGG